MFVQCEGLVVDTDITLADLKGTLDHFAKADDPLSRRDYLKSIGICRKESKEAKFWLRMIAAAEPTLREVARPIWREAKELNLIFGSIFRKK